VSDHDPRWPWRAQLSRPSRIKRGIAFSQVAVITDTVEHFVGDDEGPAAGEGAYRRQHPCLVFRMANLRPSAVCDSSFTLLFFRHDTSPRAQSAEDYVMQVGPDCPSPGHLHAPFPTASASGRS
jgi:hypothetical protein